MEHVFLKTMPTQRKSGKWRGFVSKQVDGKRKFKTQTFASEEEAKKWEYEYKWTVARRAKKKKKRKADEERQASAKRQKNLAQSGGNHSKEARAFLILRALVTAFNAGKEKTIVLKTTNETCLADCYAHFEGDSSGTAFGIQIKSTSEKAKGENKYIFNQTGNGSKSKAIKYPNIWIVCVALDKKLIWGFHGNAVKVKGLNITPGGKYDDNAIAKEDFAQALYK